VAQLGHLYNQTPALLLSVDETGRIVAGSDRLMQRLATTRERWVGTQLAAWVKPEHRTDFALRLLGPMFSGGRVDGVDCTFRTASGEDLVARLSARLEHSDTASVRRAMVSLDDITEATLQSRQLEREQALRRQIERHAQDLSDLLTERSEMLNVLAHEVRQPLNNASAALQNAEHTLLRQRGPAALEAAEPLHRAQRVLGGVLAGVDNALAVAALLAEGHGATLADLDLEMLVSIAVGDMQADDRGRIQVSHETSARTVAADAGLMRLALRNLLANALAFSPRNASVVVKISEAASGASLCIDVIDQGPGIPAEVQQRLFQRGARGPAHERRGSHGLGLYIVRRAMELQGGHAQLLHTGPQGTAIRLELNEEAAVL
jgi:signal transduction histidine kinase